MKVAALGAAIALSLPLAMGSLPAEPLYADEVYADQVSQVMELEVESEATPTLSVLQDAVASIDMDALQRSAQVSAFVAEALQHEGAPYAYGGTTPGGFDCSGFVQYCFRAALGMEVPRTTWGQSELGTEVGLDELQPGDLLFWGSSPYHVGIALGDGRYIHAAGSGQGVVIHTMDYYCPSYAMRVL